jgi:Thioredoxin-like domain
VMQDFDSSSDSRLGGAGRGSRRLVSAIAAWLALILVISAHAVSADDYRRGPGGHILVMIDDPACVYCARWRKEVGPAYANSAEGRFAPLVVIQKRDSAAHRLNDIRYTPTFILFDATAEVGRIVGYPGEEFFWSRLQEILVKAGFDPGAAKPAPRDERETRLLFLRRLAMRGGQSDQLPLR